MKTKLFGMACLLTFGLAAVMVGCVNPNDGKEEAKTNEEVVIDETVAPVEGKKYVIDTDSSAITFTGSKVSGSHSGGWKKYDGVITVPEGEFTKASIVINFDITSMFSDDADLTDTMKSEKMFDVAKYPTGKFVSTSIEKKEDGNYAVSGNLSLKDKTKNITFTADVNLKDTSLTSESEFTLNRTDFNINYDGLADDLIREKVLMTFYVEAAVAE